MEIKGEGIMEYVGNRKCACTRLHLYKSDRENVHTCVAGRERVVIRLSSGV